YVTRIGLAVALPVLASLSVAVGSISNSQGAVGHSMQILSMVVIAQTIAHWLGLVERLGDWGVARGGDPAGAMEDRLIDWAKQTVCATYLVAGITKLLATGGTWIWQARYLGLQV